MRLQVVERYASDSDALKKYVEKKVASLSRYFDKITRLDVVLEMEGPVHRVQMMAYLVNRKVIKALAESGDMYASVDQAVDKMQRQLVGFKEKLRVVRKAGRSESPGLARAEAAPAVEEVEDYPRQPLSLAEAAAELAASGRDFLVFFQEEDGEPAVLFRKKGGGWGLIRPRK